MLRRLAFILLLPALLLLYRLYFALDAVDIAYGASGPAAWPYEHDPAPLALRPHKSLNHSTIFPHGDSHCLPTLRRGFHAKANSIRSLCQRSTNFVSARARIATLTAHFGPPKDYYKSALRSHATHTVIHDTRLHVLCSEIVDDLWNKPAFILSVLLNEMTKNPVDRLEWIFWADRDTIILDQCRSISSFLPLATPDLKEKPNPRDEIHLLATNDWNGLNNGVFLLRVNRWAVDLFNDILAFRHFKPDIDLPFTEQSAMEKVMNEPQFRDNVRIVPQEWFNTYPSGEASEFRDKETEEGLKRYHARRGDFLVHFAGMRDKDKSIREWIDILDNMDNKWEGKTIQRNVTDDVNKFWKELWVKEGVSD